MIKIKDLFVNQTMPPGYKAYQDMSIEDFREIYKKMTSPNKPLQLLYQRCSEEINTPKTNPACRIVQLEVVPLKIFENYKIGGKRITPTVISCFEELGCHNLADISEIQTCTIEHAIGSKRQAVLQSKEILNYIQLKPKELLEYWNSVKPIVLPEKFDNTKSAILQLISILPSLTQILAEQNKIVMSDVIRMYCLENKSIEEIRIAMNMKTEENVLGHIRRFSYGLIDGSILINRYTFHSDFLMQLNEEVGQLLYTDGSSLSCSIGKEALLAILGLYLGNAKGKNYQLKTPIILRDISITKLTEIANCFTQILKDACYPITRDSLWEDFDANTEEYAIENKKELFDCLLNNHSAVESDKETFWLKGELLSKYQQIARIIYEHRPNPISKGEVISIFNRLYPLKEIDNIVTGDIHSKETGVNFIGKSGQLIYGNPMPSLRQALKDLLEQSDDIVMFDNLRDILEEKGYIVKEESLKSYLSYFGYLFDMNEKLRFCHKDKVDEHPEYNWAKSKKYGVQNKLLNILKEKIESTSKLYISLEKAKESIRDWCSKNDVIYHSALFAIEKKYIDKQKQNGVDAKPFYLEGSNIHINEEVSSRTDWNAIGLSGKYHTFEVYAYGLTFEFLRQSAEKRLQISVIAEKISTWAKANLPTFDISVSTIRRFFNEDSLPDELQRVTEANGDVFIIEKIPQPLQKIDDNNLQYTVDSHADVNSHPSDDVKLVVADVSTRPQVTYTDTFDWAKIKEVLPRELSYYTKFYPALLDNSTIDKFQNFLEGSSNCFLKEIVPQDLYEYWYARTNYSLNRRYLSDLARCFEPLLKDIYQRQKMRDPQTKSLADICQLGFPEFYPICISAKKAEKPLEKIFADLHFKRNKEAHGVYLEMSSASIAKCILDYTVLYIYTIAKYA